MSVSGETEHFVTLFNHKFLPMGLALHESLCRHASPVHLWIVCMDELVEAQLAALALEHVTLLPLREIETPELLAVKPGRSAGEYCWTLTPFTCHAVMTRCAEAKRVTYVDADLFFFRSPQPMFRELEASGKGMLITEHHYDPAYDQSEASGRFCVQFMTFDRSAGAQEVATWWQQRCIEWCYARHEPGRFGDQMYLDRWPGLFGEHVHILQNNSCIFAPWNVRWQLKRLLMRRGLMFMHDPVFYHFHGYRPESETWARAYSTYRVGQFAQRFYDAYTKAIGRQVQRMKKHGMAMPVFESSGGLKNRLGWWYSRLTGRGWYRWFDRS